MGSIQALAKTGVNLELDFFAARFHAHEYKMAHSFSLVPSENSLSPLARKVLASDAYARYFFDDDRTSNIWAFPGGKYIGDIQHEIVIPALRRLSNARFINVKPISGLSCMAITLKAYCSAGSKVLLIDPNMGGHSSTAGVAKHLGISPIFLPYTDTSKLDVDRLARVLRSENISLIYLDQSNCLFPVDVSILRNVITDINSETKLHVDTSHINGLILGGALENPLRLGADSFGGSFHKSFPGPHKGFFATNDPRISKEFSACANLLVSHHHAGEMLALAVSLIEFECCGGAAYARQMVTNAQAFGRVLSTAGLTVAGADGNFTKTHQVWVINDTILDGTATSQRLYEAGLIVNSFGYLPGFPSGGVRLGLNEVTRYGLLKEHSEQLAAIFADVVSRGRMETNQRLVTGLRKQFSEPAYCFTSMEF